MPSYQQVPEKSQPQDTDKTEENKEHQPCSDDIDRAMAAHPGLTEEEAENMIEEYGF